MLNYTDVLKREDKRLSSLLTRYSGRHLLQLSDYTFSSLAVSPILHKIRVSNNTNSLPTVDFTAPRFHFLLSAYTNLPFASESINLILLPHALELNKNAKQVLSESWRVLAPDGHLILLGINPLSLWGLHHLVGADRYLARNGRLYTMQTICQWIYSLGGEICHIESFSFRPPLTSRVGKWLIDKLFWLERISPWLFPYLGGIYLIVAQKRVRRLSASGFAWYFPPPLTNKSLASNVRKAHGV